MRERRECRTPRLEQPTTNAHAQSRKLDGLDAAFYFDTNNRHVYGITYPRRLPDQPHDSWLRLILPLELHRLQVRPGVDRLRSVGTASYRYAAVRDETNPKKG